ncbi:TetR/AcrR family transcriptional regulator [Nonomuraea basaltis]|uniref:TetR/AcrR family transcriptional regulator n=1 Tax=Nonomuraea basaltis TaxID=2495887 RepID=UPI00110C603D|nr:TetR/AcrR family transcriptional regulator [Nonomuraea basaltis]TMR95465.1 TetR/AcrR family transcriptional regulator [Nonomuraea basaltis]
MSDDSGTGLPASLEAAWGVRSRSAPGPKPGLTLERIVEAAVHLASTEGMATVSMVRIAKELGVSTMALYRYVAAKDELVDLMMDAGIGPPPTDQGDDHAGWREWLTRWSWDYLAVLRRRPWLLQIPITGPPITPNQIAWLERGLTRLRGTGLAENEKLSVIMLLAGFVRNWASLTTIVHQAGDQRAKIRHGSALSKLIDHQRFPAVSAAIAAGAIDDDSDDLDAEFTFGLDRILDGIDVLARQRPT